MGSHQTLTRVVLDTNIVVSALLFGGPAQLVHRAWRHKRIMPLASAEMVREYARVLSYPKFGLAESDISTLLHEEILPFLSPVRVLRVPKIVTADPSDDIFLACAHRGQADAVVSGDKHLLAIREHAGIPILTLKEFIARIGDE